LKKSLFKISGIGKEEKIIVVFMIFILNTAITNTITFIETTTFPPDFFLSYLFTLLFFIVIAFLLYKLRRIKKELFTVVFLLFSGMTILQQNVTNTTGLFFGASIIVYALKEGVFSRDRIIHFVIAVLFLCGCTVLNIMRNDWHMTTGWNNIVYGIVSGVFIGFVADYKNRVVPQGFTDTQIKYIRLLTKGETFEKLSIDLGVSVYNVRNHYTRIKKKAGVKTLAELKEWAIDKRII
jgi:DNA-binding CsgD family transcriptional regulator